MTVKRSRRRPRAPAFPLALPLALPLAALAAALAGGPVAAHPELSAVGTNRYVTLTVVGARIEIADSWLEGALSATVERRRLDGDGDGLIAESELSRAQAAAAAEAPAVGVAVDGRDVTGPSTVVIDLGLDARVSSAPVVIERRMTVDLGPGAPGAKGHRLGLALRREPERLLETEIALYLEPGFALVASARGAGAGSVPGGDRFRFTGPRRSALDDRSVTFVIAPATPPAAPAGRGAALALLAALAGLGLGGAHRPIRRAPGARAVELCAHAAFPAATAALLSYARVRLLSPAPPALPALAGALAAALGLLAAVPRAERATGHDDDTALGRAVPSLGMLALAVAGAWLPVSLAAVGPAAFGVTLAARAGAVPRPARLAGAALAAASLALAVALGSIW